MIRDEKTDLIEFLRRYLDTGPLNVEFDPGDPDDPMSGGDIGFADYDRELSFPGIYLQGENTVVPGGGMTGYTGMDAGSGGPTQDPVTTIQVDCWGGTTQTDEIQATGIHPDTLAKQLSELVWNAVQNNASGYKDYSSIGVTEPFEANDDNSSPTAYRRIAPVSMAYHRHVDQS